MKALFLENAHTTLLLPYQLKKSGFILSYAIKHRFIVKDIFFNERLMSD